MTPDELRALADRYDGSSDERDLMLADLARLCTEQHEALRDVFDSSQLVQDDADGSEFLTVPLAEWMKLRRAFAKLTELEAR